MIRVVSTRMLFILLLAPTALSAQQNNTHVKLESLNEAWELAFKNNFNRKVFYDNIQKVNNDYKAAKRYLFPTISGSFAGQDNFELPVTPVPGELVGNPGTTFNAQFGAQFAYNAGITLSKTLFDWQSSLQVQLAKNRISQTSVEAEAYDQQIKQQTAQYYFTALIATKAIQLNEQDMAAGDSVVTLVKQRLAEGATDATAVNLAAINLNSVQLSYLQNKQLLVQSLESLRYLLGLTSNSRIELIESLDGNLDQLESIDLEEDKNLKTYLYQIKGAELNEKVHKSAFVPKVVFSSYFGKQQFRDDFGMSFSNGSWSDYSFLSVNITVPLFTGFGNRNALKSSQASKNILINQYKNAQLQSAVNDSITLSALENSIAITKTSADNFKLYYNTFQLNKQKYLEGLISLDIYLKSFEDYLKSENTYLTNLSNAYSNYSVAISRK